MAKQSRMEICRRCGRVLKSEKSKELGYGSVCYKKAKGECIDYTTVPDFVEGF